MTDERFEQEVRAAARRIADGAAPHTLRARVTSIPADHPRVDPSAVRFGTRVRFGGAVVVAIAIVVAGVLIAGGLPRGQGPAAVGSAALTATTPPASAPTPTEPAQSVGLVHIFGAQPDLMAAAGGGLYGIVISGSDSGAVVLRIDPDGSITHHPLSDPLAPYYSQLIVQGSSLYVGTSVIKRFTNATDELLRIDASTLTVTARTTLPGGVVGLVSDPGNVWVALADRLLCLDPVSLAVRASHIIPGTVPPPGGPSSVSSLALGSGGLWATVGDATTMTLYQFDPASLAVLGRTTLPDPGQVSGVVADLESVWLTGVDWVRRVDPSGQLGGLTSTPGLQAAAAQGQGLVALVQTGSEPEALVQVDEAGRVVARTAVGDAGGRLALDGRDVWLLQGSSVAHWTLLIPQP